MLALITGCGNKKENKPLAAGKLYKASRIRYLYKKSKELNIKFFIFSAKYGVIESDEIISPYDMILDNNRCKKLTPQIKKKLKDFDTIIIYKGGTKKIYIECLKKALKEKKIVEFGFKNMGDIKKLEDIINASNKQNL